MKIQLDTDKKTIKLESNVKISKLLDTLKKLLPNGEYRDFTLETNTVIQQWNAPIVIHDHYPTPYWQPWYGTHYVSKSNADLKVGSALQVAHSTLTAQNTNNAVQLKSGVFNVEV